MGVKWTPPLVGEGSVPSQLEAGLVDCSSLGSVEMFFVGRDVGTGVGSRRTELLGGPLVGEAGGLCGELVQMAVGVVVSARRESVDRGGRAVSSTRQERRDMSHGSHLWTSAGYTHCTEVQSPLLGSSVHE